MENITRISDLPDQNNMIPNQLPQTPMNNNSMRGTGESMNYVPINLHPNPYGISSENPIMTPPQQPDLKPSMQMQQQYFSEADMAQMQRQRLPSRDIPHDISNHIQDEQIQPNYIPKVRFEDDYVSRQEKMTERNLQEYENKNHREKKIDILLNEIQTPIFITILFFFFQIPLINMFFKRFSFLAIYNSDGNFNFNGLLLKSMIFGGSYYLVMKLITLLSNF